MKKYYGSLVLEGAKADAAVDCMRQEGILPGPSVRQEVVRAIFGQPSGMGVGVDLDGSVSVYDDYKLVQATHKGDLTTVSAESGGRVAEFGSEFTKSPEIIADGSNADELRKKALACSLKSVGITP